MPKLWFLLGILLFLLLVLVETGQWCLPPTFANLSSGARLSPRVLDEYVRAGYRQFDVVIWVESNRISAESYIRAAREAFPNVSFDAEIFVSSDSKLSTGELCNGRVVIVYAYSSEQRMP